MRELARPISLMILCSLTLFVTSCCYIEKTFGPGKLYVAPSIKATLVEPKGWTLHEPEQEWVKKRAMSILPEYFPNLCPYNGYGLYNIRSQNYVAATYRLNKSEELALAVAFPTAYYTRKYIYGFEGECIREGIGSNAERCLDKHRQFIDIAINQANIEFDNTSVFIQAGERLFQGHEISARWHEADPFQNPELYNPSQDEVINKKQPLVTFSCEGRKRPCDYSIFYFVFEGITCTDLEGAIFSIEGISHNGKALPPLQIQLRYKDFSQVPTPLADPLPQQTPRS